MGDTPSHRDKDTLERLYHDEELTYEEIGDELGVSTSCIHKWMDKLDVETRSSAESRNLRGTNDNQHEDGPHRDPEWLREKYYDEMMSMREMAEEADVNRRTIEHQMDRHGIERRSKPVAMATHHRHDSGLHTAPTGYEKFSGSCFNESYNVGHHRLLAVAEFGFDAVSDAVVHHVNGIQWDNRHENLELMDSQSEHATYHGKRRNLRRENGRFVSPTDH